MKLEDNCYGAKDLLARHAHVVGHINQKSRLNIGTLCERTFRRTLASHGDLCTFLLSYLNIA